MAYTRKNRHFVSHPRIAGQLSAMRWGVNSHHGPADGRRRVSTLERQRLGSWLRLPRVSSGESFGPCSELIQSGC